MRTPLPSLAVLLSTLLLSSCGGSSTSARPDFASAPTLNTRVTSIQFLPDAEVDQRFDELAELALSDPEPRVRDQVVLRLLRRRDERSFPVLYAVYLNDPRHEVATAALHALRELCTAKYGRPVMNRPPNPAPSGPCKAAYDGSAALPELRPAPRVSPAEFYSAHGIAHRTTRNGEVVPASPVDARRASLLYLDPAKLQRPPAPIRSRPGLKPTKKPQSRR